MTVSPDDDVPRHDLSAVRAESRTQVDRPQICFKSWGPMPDDRDASLRDGQTGFYLVNDGIAAHEISIKEFEVEPGVCFTGELINRIKEKGDGFALVWRKSDAGLVAKPPDLFVNNAKWDLLGYMAAAELKQPGSAVYHGDYSVRVSAVYRDGFKTWYCSQADLSYIPSQKRLSFGPTLNIDSFEKSTAAGSPDPEMAPETSDQAAQTADAAPRAVPSDLGGTQPTEFSSPVLMPGYSLVTVARNTETPTEVRGRRLADPRAWRELAKQFRELANRELPNIDEIGRASCRERV